MKKIILYGLLFSIFNFSCRESNPRLIKSWVSMSDTLLRNRIKLEQDSVDHICIKKSDSLYKAAYDSIYKKRLGEMQVLLDSINQQ